MMFLSFDIGGTMTKYGIIDDKYNVIMHNSYPTLASKGGPYILNTIINKINYLKTKYSFDYVAISSGGVVDCKKGVIQYANDIIPDYTGINFVEEIKKHTTFDSSIENDVKCFALGEMLYEKEDFLMLTIGTGIGGAIVINNKIYHGKNNSAGEFGQLLVNNQKFEKIASMTYVKKECSKQGFKKLGGKDIFKLYDERNPTINSIINTFYSNLASGILSLAYVFNPPKIILGGGVTDREQFLDELKNKINAYKDEAYFHDTKIEIAKNKNFGGFIGAVVNFKIQKGLKI